jgi:transcriptional regulator with XRE-family HTH domain
MVSARRKSRRGQSPLRKPNVIDNHVGARMRLRRTLLGISQEQLAAALGLTFQQVQKYERGTNRVSASRLFQLSHVLDVPIPWFFDEMDSDTAAAGSRGAKGLAEEAASYEANPMSRRETLELVRVYYRISDRKVRKKLYQMTKALAEGDSDES